MSSKCSLKRSCFSVFSVPKCSPPEISPDEPLARAFGGLFCIALCKPEGSKC